MRRRTLEETDQLRTVLLQSVSHDLRTPLTAIKATAAALRVRRRRCPPRRAAAAGRHRAGGRPARRTSSRTCSTCRGSRAAASSSIASRVPLDELVDEARRRRRRRRRRRSRSTCRIVRRGRRRRRDAAAPGARQPARRTRRATRRTAAGPDRGARGRPTRSRSASSTTGPAIPEPERAADLRAVQPAAAGAARQRLGARPRHLARLRRPRTAARSSVETTPGGGATFVVRLPTHAGAVEAWRVRRRSCSSTTSRRSCARCRSALESQGYTVSGVTTGEQAVAKTAAMPPDLVLLDLGLPGIDGFEVLRRIRAFAPTLPIVVRLGARRRRQQGARARPRRRRLRLEAVLGAGAAGAGADRAPPRRARRRRSRRR